MIFGEGLLYELLFLLLVLWFFSFFVVFSEMVEYESGDEVEKMGGEELLEERGM